MTMRKIIIFAAILIVLTAGNAFAEQKFSIGVGWGYLHGGMGVNVALKGDHDMKYLGGGVVGYSKATGEDAEILYGATLGWIRTDILAKKSGKHGLGLVLGLNGGEGWDTEFSIRPSYTYFFKGLSQPGFNLGLAAGVGYSADCSEVYIEPGFQVGYQF